MMRYHHLVLLLLLSKEYSSIYLGRHRCLLPSALTEDKPETFISNFRYFLIG